ncbi:MAG TPA: carbon-nitrogen hydrolase family protein [Burkholderiales bacterium]|nr:carbon-nitrogen hydrolase family protein [Burkholderiales bacterium]
MTTLAAVQMVSGPEVETNLREAARLVERAAEGGARLVALPENFALMATSEGDKLAARESPGDGPIQSFLAATARRLGIWLVGGSVPLAASVPGKVRQSCLVYDHQGSLAARYDKIHLFGLDLEGERHSEARTIEPGDEVVACDSPFGRLALSICYDLRFPELYRALGVVDLILVPAAFTEVTGRAHWEPLLRARAIENLAYVVAPAQGGRHAGGRETHGDAMIVDPWGVVLNRLARGPGVVLADMDVQYQQRMRQSLPALAHRSIAVDGERRRSS